MARSIVRKKFRRVIQTLEKHKRPEFVETATSEAYLALVKATHSYNPHRVGPNGKSATFITWAYIVINSELRMFNRKNVSREKNPNSEYGNVSLSEMIQADSDIRINGGADYYYSPTKKSIANARLENRIPELATGKTFTSEEILPDDCKQYQKNLIDKMLYVLPDGTRKRVIVLFLRGKTVSEIAEKMQITPTYVRMLFQEAIALIQKHDDIKPFIEEGL